jgi:hypothetical protein
MEPVMRRSLRSAGIAVLLVLVGCLGPQAPFYPQVATTIPPVPPNQGRIYFYRDYEPYESLSRPYLYLNRQIVGISIPGGVFYRDVAPDTYEVSVYSLGAFPNQFKTIAVKPGDVFYAKIQSLRSWNSGNGVFSPFEPDTLVVAIMDPNQARSELGNMRYVQAEEPALP